MSVDGGPWTQITPEGGYPYLVREGSTAGPFPAETPIYSGSFEWSEARFELGEVSGTVQIRFRFGSDGSVNLEGWYIDDVLLMGDGPGLAGTPEAVAVPERVALYANAPNPLGRAGAATRIRFDLPQAARVRLQVFDAGGRLVRTLVEGLVAAGQRSVIWDGRDRGLRPVGSGVYFYVLETGGQRRSRQMLVLR
jgi:hypothetical protein